jgi:hypothetical protein
MIFERKNVGKSLVVFLVLIFGVIFILGYSFFESLTFATFLLTPLLFVIVLVLIKRLQDLYYKIEFLEDVIVFHSLVIKKTIRLHCSQFEFYKNENESVVKIVGTGQQKVIKINTKNWPDYIQLTNELQNSINTNFDYKKYASKSFWNGFFRFLGGI